MGTQRVVLVALTVAVAWVGLVLALRRSLHAPDIPDDQARTTALSRVQGTVADERYVREGDRWVYTFDIRPRDEPERALRVTVDADRGVLVSVAPALDAPDDRLGARGSFGSKAPASPRRSAPALSLERAGT